MKVFKLLLIFAAIIVLGSCAKDKGESKLLIHHLSDIHYAPAELYSYTGSFAYANDNASNGKQVRYQKEISDAYFTVAIKEKPDYIIISGDLTFSGHRLTHEAFARKLKEISDEGIKILVIPGNHDFDETPWITDGEIMSYTDKLTSKEFSTIYADFGYKDALSLDENSLSYTYRLDENNILLALDTMYEDNPNIPLIKIETLEWIKGQLEFAKKNNLNVIATGHHNIYQHYDFLSDGYVIYNGSDLINLFNEYNVKLYLSGHLHVQHILNESGIDEILLESFSIYPHRYGELKIDGSDFVYASKKVNVEVNYTDSTNEDLRNYSQYGLDFLKECFKRNRNNLDDEGALNVAKMFMGPEEKDKELSGRLR